VALVGKLFHARAAFTRKERSPMVQSRALGTISRCWEPDRSCHSDSASSVHWRSQRRYGGCHVVTAAENEYGQSKLYSFRNSQPVEVPERICDVVVRLRVTDQMCRSINTQRPACQSVAWVVRIGNEWRTPVARWQVHACTSRLSPFPQFAGHFCPDSAGLLG